ncbi:MAG: hypothetical protein WCA85_21090 [Paraburkholderia sp.]|uniref:hypothetical protein n=1 Tax=Paraburkholderia sp. TaxID=1926495 RepID=UPI003C390886
MRSATAQGSLQRIVPALYRWMDRSPEFTHPARVEALNEQTRAGDSALDALKGAVERHYADMQEPGVAPDRSNTLRALRRIARRARNDRKTQSPLPPLNRF